MTRRTRGICSALAGALLLSCSSGEAIDPSIDRLGRATGPAEAGRTTPAAAPKDDAASPDQPRPAHDGVVLERIQVPNYTYLRLGLADGREEWAAIPRTEIEVGAKARVVESLVMHKFRSPTLDRTFESIVFGTLAGAPETAAHADAGPAADAKPPLPPGHPPI